MHNRRTAVSEAAFTRPADINRPDVSGRCGRAGSIVVEPVTVGEKFAVVGCVTPIALRGQQRTNLNPPRARMRSIDAMERGSLIVPVYQSRHQPRKQTTIQGKIDDVERYDRYYDIAYDGIQSRTFPTIALSAGSLVVRVNNPKYDARVIPPGSGTKITNRFSGLRLDGRAGQGALYIGTIAGVLREHAYYSMPGWRKQPDKIWKPSSGDATSEFMSEQRAGAAVDPNLKFFLYQVNQTLQFADLRVTSLASFMKQMLQSGGGQRYGLADGAVIDFLARATSNPSDYSASRGIADAIFDTRQFSGLAGVCAFSSRADRDSGLVVSSEGDTTGGLIHAVFGADSSAVTSLTPVPKSPGVLAFDTYAELRAAVQ